jgi:hypothetical protein
MWNFFEGELQKVGPDMALGRDAAIAKMHWLDQEYEPFTQPFKDIALFLNPVHKMETLLSYERRKEIEKMVLEAIKGSAGPAPFLEVHETTASQRFAMAFQGGTVAAKVIKLTPHQQMDQFLAERLQIEMKRPIGWSLLLYWLSKRGCWEELSEYALKVLARLITSVGTERHFSDCGRILTLRRLGLDPEMVEWLAIILGNEEIARRFATPNAKDDWEKANVSS